MAGDANRTGYLKAAFVPKNAKERDFCHLPLALPTGIELRL